MKLVLERKTLTNESTIGNLSIDGKFFCYTLEDVVRDEKVYGQTAIPKGTYKVILNMSNRFKKVMPLVLDVPNFKGIRIHTGNSAKDSEGCILVGMSKGNNVIKKSREAYSKLMGLLENCKEEIWLTIS